jgi:heme/copper-type cytochrome/quinol oxidase subunit 2
MKKHLQVLLLDSSNDPVTVEFVAPAAGQYEIACSDFCGIGHHHMKAMLVSTQTTQTSR